MRKRRRACACDCNRGLQSAASWSSARKLLLSARSAANRLIHGIRFKFRGSSGIANPRPLSSRTLDMIAIFSPGFVSNRVPTSNNCRWTGYGLSRKLHDCSLERLSSSTRQLRKGRTTTARERDVRWTTPGRHYGWQAGQVASASTGDVANRAGG